MGKIKIGKITSAVGLKGEVKIISYSDDPMRFEMLDHVFMYPVSMSSNNSSVKDGLVRKARAIEKESKDQSEENMTAYYIENIRYKGIQPIIKLEGIEDRTAAEKVRGIEIFMDEEDLPELEEGQYYVRDIVGFEVTDEDGQILGKLKDVVTSSAQDLYIVDPCKNNEREKDILIPGVPEFILDIDLENKKIVVTLPEGLMDI